MKLMESVVLLQWVQLLFVDVFEAVTDRFQHLKNLNKTEISVNWAYILILLLGLVAGNKRKHASGVE
jgi:hypothetical protein